jgi:hypothetical protein
MKKLSVRFESKNKKFFILFCSFLVAFNCYSLKGEKHITREEIFQLLKSSVLKVCDKYIF